MLVHPFLWSRSTFVSPGAGNLQVQISHMLEQRRLPHHNLLHKEKVEQQRRFQSWGLEFFGHGSLAWFW